ncbi:DUF1692-domain-containing protein [Cristinia sonorae]|uniref:DUF1692-domain-containing protein n=1 Tax=Cristinia sonorae TaxID=1940300 RepID=A0A8K0XMS6_9AGAR|nr:DUF1692-domain-containing protein [Cristinia sonorae]
MPGDPTMSRTMTVTTNDRPSSPSLLDKLDEMVPTPLAQFDAFPKLPSTYKARSGSRGFVTLFVTFMAFLLVLNDFGEYIWGWPDYEFSVDSGTTNDMNVNVDLVVNMPCQYLSVDLRDAVGDRLYLSEGFRRDGTLFDIGQATTLKQHAEALSARQAISQSRKSRGLFATLFRRTASQYRPTYNYQPAGTACRVYGTVDVKKVTANLHITTLGHGYVSAQHVDHRLMNLSHVITEFSFGPYFPEITQPLDNSFELTDEAFVAYQYFLHVVPTTYIAPRSKPLHTNQYSVTHYTRVLQHNRGVPGIFFKFDLDPMSITIHQRTTSLLQFLIRCVGVVGGVFVCMGYAVKITSRAVDVVSGADKQQGIVAAESSGVGASLRKKWGGGELRSRVVRQGSGWVVEGGSPYSSYANTPVSGTFTNPSSPVPPSPFLTGHSHGSHTPTLSPNPTYAGLTSSTPSPRLPSSGLPLPTSPALSPGNLNGGNYAVFPPTPNPVNGVNGFPRSPIPGSPGFASYQAPPPPPPQIRRESGLRHSSHGSVGKKDD